MDEDLVLFIRTAIRSVWALEILLLLRRDRARAWTADAIADELRSNPNLAGEVLECFEAVGLLARRPEGLIFSPASPLLDEITGRLEQTYRERPVAVVNAIVTSPNDRLQSFADAFKLKGGPKS